VVPLHEGPPLSLLWARRTDGAPALGGFHVSPGGLIEPADARAPHDGGEGSAARVAALRELFEEVGLLHAEGAERLDAAARDELRDALREDADEGMARFAALSLRWRTADLVPLGRWVTPSYAKRRFDTRFFALAVPARAEPDPDLLELDAAEWITPAAALARWGRAGAVMAPPLYTVLRSLDAHGALRPEELRGVFGAAGEESLRWEVVPWVQMLPLRTPTLPPATHTNSYLVGSGEALLVEPATPYDDELERAVAWVEESRRAGISPVALFATHHHRDHVGGARALAARLGLPLWGHRLTAERLAGELRFDRLIDDGERIALDGPVPVTLRAVHTPGHAPGHLCLVEEASGAMIAGDMVAGVGTILVEPNDGDMALYLESLERMRREAPSVLLPAHGWPLHRADAVLAHYVAHRLEREAKVRDALGRHGGPARPMDLVPDAYGDAPKAVWPLAAMSTEAHLIKLERDGAARRTDDGWHPAA
jgi:glyoxylase-like metal-dependent hydrolase (beta-lactamase superfamily II)/8-oxo-dGTP pyrophosphatase MutT (NUDIX family)